MAPWGSRRDFWLKVEACDAGGGAVAISPIGSVIATQFQWNGSESSMSMDTDSNGDYRPRIFWWKVRAMTIAELVTLAAVVVATLTLWVTLIQLVWRCPQQR